MRAARVAGISLLVVLACSAGAGAGGYAFLQRAAGEQRECEAALRVGMGDSGAAEQAAILSPACDQLSDDELARARARVEVRILREFSP